MAAGHYGRVTRMPPGEAVEARQIPAAPSARAAADEPAEREAQAARSQPTTDAPPVTETSAAASGPDPDLAHTWRRLLAFVIDAVILTLVTGALWGRLLASFANRMSRAAAAIAGHSHAARGAYGRVLSHTTGPYLLVLVPTIILAILYYWLLTGYWGTTIGKRAVGAWVVTAADRSRVSLRRAFVRALVFVLGGEVIPLFFVVDNLWMTADARLQARHDRAAGTLVVRTPPPGPESGDG